MRHLPKPRGWWEVEREFPPGWKNKPERAICVSLCGSVNLDHLTIHAEPGRDYDWSFLECFFVIVAVKPGIDATRTITALYPVAEPYLTLVDVERKAVASIMQLVPRVRMQPERWSA